MAWSRVIARELINTIHDAEFGHHIAHPSMDFRVAGKAVGPSQGAPHLTPDNNDLAPR